VRRPEPRLGVSVAGVGVAVAVIGVLVWGGDYLAGSGSGAGGPSDSHRLLGIALSLVTIAIGYALAIGTRSGPLATAGVAASALGIPVLLGFLTFTAHPSSGPPFSFDAVVLVSVAIWLLSYAVVPGTRGHGFYLGLASTLMWIYVIDKAEPAAFSPLRIARSFLPAGLGFDVRTPDWGTVSLLSFLFGLGYYAIMAIMDRVGRSGAAVPLAVSGFLATSAGIAAAAPGVHAKGTGALLVVVGAALAAVGARSVRRFTTWVWAAAVGVGVVVLIADTLRDNTSGAGVTLIVCGVVLVAAGHVVSRLLRERPDDAVDG
jgi:hypothetical protein